MMTTTKFDKRKKIREAQEFLKSDKTEEESKLDKERIRSLGIEFQNRSIFSYARRVFHRLNQYFPDDEDITERLAICTYKDTDLPSEIKYAAAEKLLIDSFERGGKISNPNVLGILGSIYKKKWQYENYSGHLYQSLRYYIEGGIIAEKDPEKYISELGYCCINIAYIYTLLSTLEKSGNNNFLYSIEDPFHENAKKYADKATEYREKIRNIYQALYVDNESDWDHFVAQNLNKQKFKHFWFFVTWAEALIGLEEFDEASEKFSMALTDADIPYWMKHSASLQGFHLIELLFASDRDKAKKGNDKMAKAKRAMKKLFGHEDIPDNQNEKVGLALSGGGFRASLFHIGVLARLAEADLLRKIEVISCVSGGSILGAYYYLKLKKLLESKEDQEIKREDYIQLVAEIEKEFLEKIQQNLRGNIFSNLIDNFSMIFDRNYTRTSKTIDLYDELLYKDLLPNKPKIYMSDLLITPKAYQNPDGEADFNPGRDNWKLENKVPTIVLNSTTLNTGHAWQFTATWMGESPLYINSEFDALPNLRRMYYEDEAPGDYDKMPLSKAVAASAGVPGLFVPVEFPDLYESFSTVGLVDGGVYDNQGIFTLYEQECNVVIVSDSSGQLPVSKVPPNDIAGVVGRSIGIMQERIRASQFKELEARKKTGLISDFALMHFTKGLRAEVVNWKECDDPYIPPESDRHDYSSNKNTFTDYKINKEIQRLLAKIRTDLDTFHDIEAFSLMYSGYRMTVHELKLAENPILKTPENPDEEEASLWKFMDIKKNHKEESLIKQLEKKLIPSSELLTKIYHLSKSFRTALRVFFFGGIAGIGWMLYQLFKPDLIYVLVGIVFIVAERLISNQLKIKSIVFSILTRVMMIPIMILLWLIFLVIQPISTKWYSRLGRLP